MKSFFLISTSLSLVIIACSGESGDSFFGGKSMPENPESLVITWSDGGGMLPEGENIYISKDSSYWSMWRMNYDQKIYFNTSEEELKTLYQVFLDNDYANINLIEEQEVYDRGGTSIRVVADGEYYDKNNSGMTFVHENSWDEYNAVNDAIYTYTMSKIESSKVPVKIKLADELVESNYLIYINVNDRTLFDNSSDSLLSEKDTLLFAAPNGFDVMLYRKDSLDSYGNEAFHTSFQFIKTISATDNTVEFGIDKAGILTGK